MAHKIINFRFYSKKISTKLFKPIKGWYASSNSLSTNNDVADWLMSNGQINVRDFDGIRVLKKGDWIKH